MNMKTEVNKTEPTTICNGCGVGMSDLEIEYITEDGFEYCSDCNAAIQADDESSGRLEKKQQAILLLGRELTKSESGLLALFMNDGDYEMYMDASNNLAYRKCYEIGREATELNPDMETVEQAAERYLQVYSNEPDEIHSIQFQAFRAGANWRQALPTTTDEWVKCSERLPEDGQIVEAWCGTSNQRAEYTRGQFERYVDICDRDRIMVLIYSNVTHWQPLPNKPNQ